MRWIKSSWTLSPCILLMLAACSGRTVEEQPDAGRDAGPDRTAGGTGGGGGANTSGAGGATGGAGGFGGTGGAGGATGGAGGFGASGGAGGTTGGAGGFGGIGGAGGSGGFGGGGFGGGGFGGGGGAGGFAGRGGFSGTGGFAGRGGFAGFAGAGFAGSWAGTGGKSGSGGAAGSAPEGGPVPPIEGGVPEGGAPLPPWDDPSCPGGAGSPLLGTWTGYIENYRFESGSDVLKLTITGADTSKICGALTFGDSTPLPPPNPDVAYPPGIDMQKWQPPLPFERFPHTLFNGSVSGKRVRFENRGFEPVRSWCDLQQGYQTYAWDNRYRCVDVPNGSWDTELRSDAGLALICFANDPSTGQKRYIDCGKIHECLSWTVCACNSTGCTAETTSPLNFDAQFDAGEAHGSIALPTPAGTQVFNVHFSKTD